MTREIIGSALLLIECRSELAHRACDYKLDSMLKSRRSDVYRALSTVDIISIVERDASAE